MIRAALLAALLLPAACQKLECGDGTVEVDDVCVPTELLDCGDGTLREGDECLPADPLDCGPGTIRVDDECQPEDTLECGEGTVRRGDECVPVDNEWVYLPAPAGSTLTVSQGSHGRFSHSGSAVHALDFPMAEGTDVAAVRAGRVYRIREDSDSGCGTSDCSDQANYVLIDHGDGTIASYYHLQLDGALVDVGDVVERGQVIARSGNTGWSTGPHLHLQINDLLYQSVPIRFEDLRDVSNGYVFGRGIDFTSGNTREAPSETPQWSDCPADLFGWLGIRLDPGVPCTAAVRDREYTITGTQFGNADKAVWATSNVDWTYNCVDSGTDGTFEGTVTYDAERGYEFFIAGAGESDCTLTNGWPYSPRIQIVDE